jgi:hypothetical protein
MHLSYDFFLVLFRMKSRLLDEVVKSESFLLTCPKVMQRVCGAETKTVACIRMGTIV